MRLPQLANPSAYTGLFIYDFGDHAAVGYTAEEIEVLQCSADHCGGQAYQIHGATGEGGLLLRGMTTICTDLDQAMLFWRASRSASEQDYAALVELARGQGPPCPMHCSMIEDARRAQSCTVIAYAGIHSAAVGQWLLRIDFCGGDQVESGAVAAGGYVVGQDGVRATVAIAPDHRWHARAPADVLSTTHQRIQRTL